MFFLLCDQNNASIMKTFVRLDFHRFLALVRIARYYIYLKTQIKDEVHSFFYKNNFYKNSEPQIKRFPGVISENINAGIKITTQNGRRDPQMHFKHIFGGGQGLILAKLGPKIRTTEAQPSFTGSYKKEYKNISDRLSQPQIILSILIFFENLSLIFI